MFCLVSRLPVFKYDPHRFYRHRYRRTDSNGSFTLDPVREDLCADVFPGEVGKREKNTHHGAHGGHRGGKRDLTTKKEKDAKGGGGEKNT